MSVRDYDGISLQNRRARNMASRRLNERQVGGRQLLIAVVCDGVGSLMDGAWAAREAVRMLGLWFDGVGDMERLGLKLRDQVLEINREICRTAKLQALQTATTLSALLLDGDRYYIVHLGDSRIYRWGQGGLMQLTQDQVLPSGKLAASLGHTDQVIPFYNEGDLGPQKFLLCSDGLYKRMEPEVLLKGLDTATGRNLKKTMQELARYVIERGEQDNISIALVINE